MTAAVAGIIAFGFTPSPIQAVLPSVTFDLRVHDTGGKEATLAAVGDSVLLDLYAVSAGLNGTPTDDRISSALGWFLSSTGGLLGDLLGQRPPAPYDSPFQTGKSKDLDGDGDLDVGGTGSLEAYAFRVPPLPPAQPVGGQFVGQVKFTLRTAPATSDASTAVNYLLESQRTSVLAFFDGGSPVQRDPLLMTVLYASPVVIHSSAVDPGSGATSLSGTFSILTINNNCRVLPGNTLTLTDGINVVAGGTLDSSGGGTTDIRINNATSGNSGGQLLVGPIKIGTTAAGTFIQSAGYSRVGDVTIGIAGGASGQLLVTGGKLDAGSVVVKNGSFRATNGSATLAALELSNGSSATIEGGDVLTSGNANVGLNSVGSLIVRGGTHGVSGDLLIGRGTSTLPARGMLRVEGGTLSAWRTFIGAAELINSSGNIGHIEQTGGVFNGGTMRMGGPSPSEASTFLLSNGLLHPNSLALSGHSLFTQTGGQVDSTGTIAVMTAAEEHQYALSGGSLSAPYLSVNHTNAQPLIGSGQAGGFAQTGGNVTIGELLVDTYGTYDAVGGTLALTKSLRLKSGKLNLGGNAIPVSFGTNCFADFTKGQLIGAQQATFTAGPGSLLSFATNAQLASVGTINTLGLIHVAGQPLTIPSNKFVGGSGTIEGNVTNIGAISPGNSPGAIIVDGNYAQANEASLLMEIAGLGSDKFDTLTVNGSASLDGFLSVFLLDGFIPAEGNSFTILTASSITGTFDNAASQVELSGGRFDVLYSSTAVTLSNFQPVPEPGSMALFAIASAGLLRRRRWN